MTDDDLSSVGPIPEGINKRANEMFGKPFTDCTDDEMRTVLAAINAAAVIAQAELVIAETPAVRYLDGVAMLNLPAMAILCGVDWPVFLAEYNRQRDTAALEPFTFACPETWRREAAIRTGHARMIMQSSDPVVLIEFVATAYAEPSSK